MSQFVRSCRTAVALAALGAALVACGSTTNGEPAAAPGGDAGSTTTPVTTTTVVDEPPVTGTTTTTTEAPVTTGAPTAKDGTNLAACRDLSCSVLITGTRRIPLNSSETDGMTVRGNGSFELRTNDGGGAAGSGGGTSGSFGDFRFSIDSVSPTTALVRISPA